MASTSTIYYPDREKKSSLLAWTIWLLGALFMFYKYALEVAPSVMTHALMSDFNITATDLGNLAGSYFYSYLLLQIPCGLLLDRFGPRRVTSIAILLSAVGSLIFAYAPTLWIAELGRFITGAGTAFAAVNCLKLISDWFPKNKMALMAGLMMTLAMLGAVFGQAPLSIFIEKMHTWRHAMELIGIVGVFLSILFWFVVKDKTSLNTSYDENSPPLSLKESIIAVIRNPQSWWLSFYSGLAFAPVMIFGGLWGVPFLAQAYQTSQNIAASAVSMIFIGFAVGAPILGWFSDKIQRRKAVMLIGTFLAALLMILIIYVPLPSTIYLSVLLFFFGFTISSFLLSFTMIQEINLIFLAATAIGFMNAFDALFGALSDPLCGKLLDLSWNGLEVGGARIFSTTAYKWAFSLIPLYMILALLSLIPVKETFQKVLKKTS